MRVNLNGTLSKTEPLSVGVPQGSVLGPLLFIIFINDFCALPIFLFRMLFANDSTIFLSEENIYQVVERVRMDMILICEWLKHNQLILNWEKTHAMFFPFSSHDHTNPLTLPTNIFIKIDNHFIDFVTETKILGVTLDNKLKFENHIYNITKKVNAKSFMLSRNIKMFPSTFRTTLFKLFVVPNFDYCSTLFAHLGNKANNSKLQSCFMKAAKRILYIDLYNKLDSEQFKILKHLNILPFVYRQFYHFVCFIHIVIKNEKLLLHKKIYQNKTARFLRSKFSLPQFKKKFKLFSFEVSAVKILNIFQANIFNEKNSSQFKSFLNENILEIFNKSFFKDDQIFVKERIFSKKFFNYQNSIT